MLVWFHVLVSFLYGKSKVLDSSNLVQTKGISRGSMVLLRSRWSFLNESRGLGLSITWTWIEVQAVRLRVAVVLGISIQYISTSCEFLQWIPTTSTTTNTSSWYIWTTWTASEPGYYLYRGRYIMLNSIEAASAATRSKSAGWKDPQAGTMGYSIKARINQPINQSIVSKTTMIMVRWISLGRALTEDDPLWKVLVLKCCFIWYWQ